MSTVINRCFNVRDLCTNWHSKQDLGNQKKSALSKEYELKHNYVSQGYIHGTKI